MSDSLSLLGKNSFRRRKCGWKKSEFKLGGSFFGENEDNMREEETDHVAEVSD